MFNNLFEPIIRLWCKFAGDPVLAAVLAGIAIVGLIIMFIVDEGGSYISTTLRIVLGAGLLIALPTLIGQIFPRAAAIVNCTAYGGGLSV